VILIYIYDYKLFINQYDHTTHGICAEVAEDSESTTSIRMRISYHGNALKYPGDLCHGPIDPIR
jgi:hypothetical protein